MSIDQSLNHLGYLVYNLIFLVILNLKFDNGRILACEFSFSIPIPTQSLFSSSYSLPASNPFFKSNLRLWIPPQSLLFDFLLVFCRRLLSLCVYAFVCVYSNTHGHAYPSCLGLRADSKIHTWFLILGFNTFLLYGSF